MGSRIAIGAGLALVIGLGIWTALPRSDAGSPARDHISAAPLGQPTAPAATAPAATAPAPAGGGDVHARVDACLAVQREVGARRQARGGPAPAGEPSDAAVVAQACAPLFAQPACRDAQLRFDQPPPETRAATVFQACARAYCPILPAPKPSACERQPADGQETFIAWNELRTAILRHDIGDAEATRAFSR
jgi:hypothetical protein